MKALTAAEMREVDRLTTAQCGIFGIQLMEAAGKHVCDAVLRGINRLQRARNGAVNSPVREARVSILCGKGNNGGDGFVAARHLRVAGVDAQVYLFGDASRVSGDAGENLQRWRNAGGSVAAVTTDAEREKAWKEIAESHVIVDALLGTGLRGPATGLMARAISELNELSGNATAVRPALMIAVDMPSGLPSDGGPAEGPVLRGHRTVTFSGPKIGQLVSSDAVACGVLEVCQIGSPKELVEKTAEGSVRSIDAEEFSGMRLIRAADANKGSYGHVLLVAGSMGKSGAAILAGRMALRGGAGLVTIAVPAPVLPIVAVAQAECMTEALEATPAGTVALENSSAGRWEKIEKGKSVLAIGPGLGGEPETQEFIREITTKTALPVILDADGLNAFAGHGDQLRERKTEFLAITPHPGEMARLLEVSIGEVQSDRLKAARESARRWNAHVILKGFHTIIAAPDGRVFVNTTGNAGLAKGGTGDALTGLLAAMLAQFKAADPLKVLALGVYLHGLAAEIASEYTDVSALMAGDLIEAIGDARATLVEELQRGG